MGLDALFFFPLVADVAVGLDAFVFALSVVGLPGLARDVCQVVLDLVQRLRQVRVWQGVAQDVVSGEFVPVGEVEGPLTYRFAFYQWTQVALVVFF